MGTINLQYLAFIPYGLSVYCMIWAVIALIKSFGGTDIEPMLYISLSVYYFLWSIGLSILAWLIWKAFRTNDSTSKND